MKEVYDPPLIWDDKIKAPLVLFRTIVRPNWIDEFGHMSFIHYLTVTDHGNWAFWNWINCPHGTMKARAGHECVIVENHVRYISELTLGMQIHLTTQLINFDEKRFIIFHHIWKSKEQELAATIEVKNLGFNLVERRPERWLPVVAQRLEQVRERHWALGLPATAGKGIVLLRQ